jgi:primosomal protein N' (replication factor Y) (superfamily II helicase)
VGDDTAAEASSVASRHGALRSVRVRTEVAALTRAFDYSVPDSWQHDVRVGTRVRVPLHGRSVRGWVIGEDEPRPASVEVLPLKSWLGWGPPPAVVDLTAWASWRWAGPQSFFLRAASPTSVVRALPAPPLPPLLPAPAPQAPPAQWSGAGPSGWAETLSRPGVSMVRLPPATDLIDLVLAVLRDVLAGGATGGATGGAGSVVVLAPSTGWAERLGVRLARRGYPVAASWDEARAGWPLVVGSRVAAWAPVPHLAAAIVLDAHDAAYREESAPTYSAVDVLMERARRVGAPCVLASPVPPVSLTAVPHLHTVAPSAVQERAGWPALEIVDRRGADPRTGMFSEEFVRLARAVLDDGPSHGAGPLVCVYNRTGGARLLACRHCGELACCDRCGAAAAQPREEDVLRCPRCGSSRPVVCERCGHLRMKIVRAGVSRLRDELAALLGTAVSEVSGVARPDGEPVPEDRALVGTEAVLHRVRHAAAVAFLDIDLHLLAPRLGATEETLALLVRAGRLVGGRGSGPPWARVLVQTRVPSHPVLTAAARGEPATVLDEEATIRRDSALPPFVAVALVSGAQAPAYADALGGEADVVRGAVSVVPLDETRYLVRAASHEPLCDVLARVPRPPGRGLRVEVDPVSV